MSINTKLFLTFIVIIIIGGIAASVQKGILGDEKDANPGDSSTVTSFAECVEAGHPVMESYPRQCRADGETFVEDIGNALQKQDLIRVQEPSPNATISSPLTVSGEARGYWFFEATFPVTLLDGNGDVVTETFAQADGEWMTEDFVPFETVVLFDQPTTETGTLILHRNNASGLPEHDDQLRIPVTFSQQQSACVRAGCSRQLCVSEDEADIVTTCEYHQAYECYETATCEMQESGECGWTQTPTLNSCLQEHGA